jgi:hypothetical protein
MVELQPELLYLDCILETISDLNEKCTRCLVQIDDQKSQNAKFETLSQNSRAGTIHCNSEKQASVLGSISNITRALKSLLHSIPRVNSANERSRHESPVSPGDLSGILETFGQILLDIAPVLFTSASNIRQECVSDEGVPTIFGYLGEVTIENSVIRGSSADT